MSDAVTITTKARSTLVFASAVGTCRIPATRGIFFNGISGGSVYPRTFQISAEAGTDVEILGPLKASGLCSNSKKQLKIEKIGLGTLTLSGPVTLENADTFTFTVSDGRVVLGSKTAFSLTNELSDAVWLKSPSATECAVSGFAFGEGAGLIVRHENGAAGTFVLGGSILIVR